MPHYEACPICDGKGFVSIQDSSDQPAKVTATIEIDLSFLDLGERHDIAARTS